MSALEMDQLAFGQATLNSRITRRLMLQNLGDMPSTFRMEKERFAPDFSVSPLEGYLQANEDTNLEITFHPSRVDRDIRYEKIPLFVDGQAPLSLTLTGICIEASAELKEMGGGDRELADAAGETLRLLAGPVVAGSLEEEGGLLRLRPGGSDRVLAGRAAAAGSIDAPPEVALEFAALEAIDSLIVGGDLLLRSRFFDERMGVEHSRSFNRSSPTPPPSSRAAPGAAL